MENRWLRAGAGKVGSAAGRRDLIYRDSHNSHDVAPPAHPRSPPPSPPPPARARPPPPRPLHPLPRRAPSRPLPPPPPGRPRGGRAAAGGRQGAAGCWHAALCFPAPTACRLAQAPGDSHTGPGANSRATHAAPGARPKFPLFPRPCHLTSPPPHTHTPGRKV